MTEPLLAGSGPPLAGYVLVFGLAAVVCFAGVSRARSVEDEDTRRGLVALLLTSGGWAAAHVGYLLAPTPGVALLFYYVGLVVGFSTVGPWLYLCSAYTGRTLHRSPAIRKLAVGVFVAVVLVKVTNPIHGVYFRAEWVTSPFPYLMVENLPLHWTTMGLAYALAGIGYFMLVELFWQVDHDAGPLVALVGITGLPLVLDVAGMMNPWLLDITYEPLGVAAFAVGILYVFLEDFRTVQLTGSREEPVVLLDDDDRVRDYNRAAQELFPDLASGERIDVVLPEIAAYVDDDEAVVHIPRQGGMRYYQLSTNAFSTDSTQLGRVVMFTDITEREEYRTELERQNERLENFASMVSHDLRNPLNVAKGQVEIAREDGDSEPLAQASNSLDRMEELIGDLLTLARQGQPLSETEPVSLAAVTEDAWSVVESRDATMTVADDVVVDADADRLQQLFENLFRNAIEHAGDDVAIQVGTVDEGFYVADDGPGIPPDKRDDVFSSGYSTNEDGTGFGLAIVSEIVDAHGWEITVTDGEGGGARFEVTGVPHLEPTAPDDPFAAQE